MIKLTQILKAENKSGLLLLISIQYCFLWVQLNSLYNIMCSWPAQKMRSTYYILICTSAALYHTSTVQADKPLSYSWDKNFVAPSKNFWLANLFILKVSLKHNLHIYSRNILCSVSRKKIYTAFNISDLKITSTKKRRICTSEESLKIYFQSWIKSFIT